jgi:hypothetical protein
MLNAATLKTEPQDNARANAAAWNDAIVQVVAALECDYDRLTELRDEQNLDDDELAELANLEAACTIDGDKMADADEARTRIDESVLSVEVRSDWAGVGDELTPGEFRIVLTTGGPGCQIRGQLDDHGEPSQAWMEYQDWGTPWTESTSTPIPSRCAPSRRASSSKRADMLAPVTTVTVSRAITIARTLGTRRAAGYCRNNGLPLVVALYWLIGSDAASRCLYGD